MAIEDLETVGFYVGVGASTAVTATYSRGITVTYTTTGVYSLNLPADKPLAPAQFLVEFECNHTAAAGSLLRDSNSQTGAATHAISFYVGTVLTSIVGGFTVIVKRLPSPRA